MRTVQKSEQKTAWQWQTWSQEWLLRPRQLKGRGSLWLRGADGSPASASGGGVAHALFFVSPRNTVLYMRMCTVETCAWLCRLPPKGRKRQSRATNLSERGISLGGTLRVSGSVYHLFPSAADVHARPWLALHTAALQVAEETFLTIETNTPHIKWYSIEIIG